MRWSNVLNFPPILIISNNAIPGPSDWKYFCLLGPSLLHLYDLRNKTGPFSKGEAKKESDFECAVPSQETYGTGGSFWSARGKQWKLNLLYKGHYHTWTNESVDCLSAFSKIQTRKSVMTCWHHYNYWPSLWDGVTSTCFSGRKSHHVYSKNYMLRHKAPCQTVSKWVSRELWLNEAC